jgi:hypothetical protein
MNLPRRSEKREKRERERSEILSGFRKCYSDLEANPDD